MLKVINMNSKKILVTSYCQGISNFSNTIIRQLGFVVAALMLVLALSGFTAEAPAIEHPTAIWGTQGSGEGQFNTPTGLAVDIKGNVLVVDQGNRRVQVFTPEGKFIRQFKAFKDKSVRENPGDNLFKLPDRIAVGPEGMIFVTDFSAHCIFKFSPDGDLLDIWGGKGGTLGRLNNPKGIFVNTKGEVYVADTSNTRLQKFSQNGEALYRYFKYSMRPVDMVELKNGNILAITAIHAGSLWTFKGDGELVGAKWLYTNLPNPTGIDLDANDNLYISSGENRIYKYSPDGTKLDSWGEHGDGPGQFNFPSDVALDHQGNLYVADKYNNRIQKFTFIKNNK